MAADTDECDGVRVGDRHLAHSPDVLDRVMASTVTHEPDRVDPDLVEPYVVRGNPARGQAPQACPLLPGDRFERSAVPGSRAGLDLADDERAALGGDDVEFTLAAAPVAAQDPQACRLQKVRGRLFALPAEDVLGMQCDHLRLKKWRAAARAGQAKNSLWMGAAEGGAVWAGRLKCQTRVLSVREGCACPGGRPRGTPDELCLPGRRPPGTPDELCLPGRRPPGTPDELCLPGRRPPGTPDELCLPGGRPPEPPDELCAQEGDKPHLPCNR